MNSNNKTSRIIRLFIIFYSINNFALCNNHQLIIQIIKKELIDSVFHFLENNQKVIINEHKCLSESLNIWLICFTSNEAINVIVNNLLKNSDIINVQFNKQIKQERFVYPNDYYFNKQLDFISNNNGYNMGILDSWQITTGGVTIQNDSIVIAVIDNGFNINHPDIHENIWINRNEIEGNQKDDDLNGYVDDIYGWNFKDNNNDITNSKFGHWHGTPIDGIIGAVGNNNIGVCGINWKVKIMNIVKGNDESSIIQAYDYVLMMRKKYNQSKGKSGAFIVGINNSFGKDNLKPEDCPIWCEMFDSLGKEGILTVASTVNANVNVDIVGDMPTSCDSKFIITVTNINNSNIKITNAGFGKETIDIAAFGDFSYTIDNLGGYDYFSGTSAAAPFVTGAIGLLYSLKSDKFINIVKTMPDSAAILIKEIILNSVDSTDDLIDLTSSGGILNIYKSILTFNKLFDTKITNDSNLLTFELINYYPHPTNSFVYFLIKLNGNYDINISIINYTGYLVKSLEYNNFNRGMHAIKIDMNDLSSGLYFCLLQCQNNLIVKRIIKY